MPISKHLKNRLSSSALAALLALCLTPPANAAVPEDSRVFTPYFNMSLAEGAYVPSQGNVFSGGVINAQTGLLTKLDDRNSILGLYNLLYNGPAFHPQDNLQFQQRSMAHNFSGEYRHTLEDEHWTIRPGIAYAKTYTRSGANESWDSGLYNYNSLGGQLALDYHFGWFENAGTITGQYLYRSLRFPNYTDLLQEFEGSGSASELDGGQQDQKIHQFMLQADWRGYFGGVTYSLMRYANQNTLDNSGLYAGDKQQDSSVRLDFGLHKKLGALELAPRVSLVCLRSNQSFLRYKYFGALPVDVTNPSADVTLIPDAYSYNQYELDLPVDLALARNSRWEVSFDANAQRRVYTSRPPRDADNNYLSGQQENTLLNFTAGFKRHLNEVADMRVTYTFTIASSNNSFETYMPYNYTGNNLSLAYDVSF